MLHGSDGYRLSPAYDLLPDIHGNQEHVLFFGLQRYIESRRTILEMARRWGIADSGDVLDQVLTGLSRFGQFAQLAGVPPGNVAEIQEDLQRRARNVQA